MGPTHSAMVRLRATPRSSIERMAAPAPNGAEQRAMVAASRKAVAEAAAVTVNNKGGGGKRRRKRQ